MELLLATSQPSHGAQALLYVLAVVAFVVAAVLAGISRAHVAMFTAIGLTLVALVFAWVQLAAS